MTSDPELVAGLASVMELARLKRDRRFTELADRADEILHDLGPPAGRGDHYSALVGTVASFGALAAYELSQYSKTLGFAEAQVSAGRLIADPSVTLAHGLNWRALANEMLGRLVAAATDYQEGLAIARALVPPDPAVEEELRLNYSDMQVKRGERSPFLDLRPDTAQPDTSAGAALAGPAAGEQDLQRANQAAVNSIVLGRLDEGVAMLMVVMRQARLRGDHRAAGVAASNAGQALVDVGRPESGLLHLLEARQLLRRPGLGEQLAVACYNLGLTYRQLNDDEKAIAAFKEGWDAFRAEAPKSLRVLPLLRELTLQRILQKDFRRARAALNRGLDIYDSVRSEVGTREREHEGTMRSYRSLLELHLFLSLDDGWIDEAMTLIDRGKARFWTESLAALAPVERIGGLTGQTRSTRTIRYQRPTTAGGGFVLNFFVGPNATFIASGPPARPAVRRIDVGEDALRDLVEDVIFELLASPSRGGADRTNTVALGRLLLAGVDLADTRRLFVLPDGPLWALPFDALPLPDDAGSLGDELPVVIAPSLPVLSRLSERAGEPPHIAQWRVLALGGPAAGPDFPAIPGTVEQVSAIGRRLPGTCTLTGKRASRQTLAQQITTATHIHIAAHAFGTPDSDVPHIVLSDGADGPDLLYATEIAQWHLQAELVFLSACGTSVARLSSGEGATSIGRAFILAGARCVIATLWPIEDTEAVDLISLFYQRLAEGVSPAQAALYARQQARAMGAGVRTWSALQVIGDGFAGENMFEGVRGDDDVGGITAG
ncbi:CHAT domain-containing protein [Frankia sp. CiP3]|uniref:CHAT domain-containing protein n=1 Tax=Frankia sp. CiP3 TaxID=2880971 RepID=UPI001EF68F31|nr:CHAT domain-containing protein [Frankia sp. CiP3]